MIRLAFMTDKARVLGASTSEENRVRLRLLPRSLGPVMQEILVSDNVAFGSGSAQFYAGSDFARNDKYVLTRDENYQASGGCTVCHDYMELVDRFKDSEDELTVIGGLIILKLFTPYAASLDVAETTELVPGDLVFDDWDKGNFELVDTTVWRDGKTLHYERKS